MSLFVRIVLIFGPENSVLIYFCKIGQMSLFLTSSGIFCFSCPLCKKIIKIKLITLKRSGYLFKKCFILF